MGYLTFTRNGPDKPVEIGASVIVVGRSPDCDVPIDDSQLSRRHCRFIPEGGTLLLEDLESANGTRLNGARLDRPRKLKPGDRVTIGHTDILYSTNADGADDGGTAASADDADAVLRLELKESPAGTSLPTVIPLSGRRYTLGRKSTNDIALKANVISGYHCEFVRHETTYRITDLDSTNGVRVNGEKKKTALLSAGDIIAFDTVAYTVVDPGRLAEISAAKLVVLEGNVAQQEIPLASTVITFGRKSTNTHPVRDDTEISSHHCRVERNDEGRYVVVDLGSTNGTRVDGSRIDPETPVVLDNGSQLRFGTVVIRVVDPGAPEAKKTRTRSKSGARPKTASPGTRRDTAREGTGTRRESAGTQRSRAAADGLAGELDLDAAVADAPGGDDVDDDLSDLDQETADFVRAARGAGRKRGLAWRLAEVGVGLAVLGAAAFALISASHIERDEGATLETLDPPGGSKLTRNWSFEGEAAGEAGSLDGWRLWGDPEDAAYPTTEVAASGRASLEVYRGSSDYTTTDVLSDQDLDVVAGQALVVGARVRRLQGTGGGAGLKIEFWPAGGNDPLAIALAPFATGSNEWHDLVATVPVPEGAVAARVACSVVGANVRFAFDDVTVQIEETTGRAFTGDELSAGPFVWRVDNGGRIALHRTTEDGRIDTLLRDGDVSFATPASRGAPGLIGDLTLGRVISRIGGPAPALQLVCTVLTPFDTASGGSVPTFAATVTLSFSQSGDELHPTLEVDCSAPMRSTGLVARLPGVNHHVPLARFERDRTTIGTGNPASDSRLVFHRLPLFGPDGMASASRIVVPRGGERADGDAPAESHLGIHAISGSDLRVALEPQRQQLVLLDVMKPGRQLDLVLVADPASAAIADARRHAQEVESHRAGAAIAATLEWMRLALYDLDRIREAARDIRRIVSGLEYRIEDFRRNMRNLRDAFTRDRYLRTQEQMQSLLDDLAPQVLADAPRGFLTDVTPGRREVPDELDYRPYFVEVRERIAALESVQDEFADMNRTHRTDVDAATLARLEDDVRSLLARGIDYDDAGLRAMAIELYREVLRVAPLSRPATVARERLVGIAGELLAEADELAGAWPELAADRRFLVTEMLAAPGESTGHATHSVLANEWREAPGADPQPIWDASAGVWAMPRTHEFVEHVYAVERDRPAGTNLEGFWRAFQETAGKVRVLMAEGQASGAALTDALVPLRDWLTAHPTHFMASAARDALERIDRGEDPAGIEAVPDWQRVWPGHPVREAWWVWTSVEWSTRERGAREDAGRLLTRAGN